MSAATQEPLRLVPAAPRRAGAAGWRVYLAGVATIVIATVAAVAFSAAWRPRGLSGLPPTQRAAVLSRTVDDLRELCGPGHAAALDDHCRELASFAARFEECRGECEAVVRPLLAPTPTR